MPEQNLTPEILAAALQGLEAQQARLDAHIAEVRRMLGARPQKLAAPTETPKRKRRMSAAGRRRIAAASKKRWAEFHQQKAAATQKAKEPAAATKIRRPRRKMSAAGRKRIVEATRKRWAEFHRQKAAAAKAKKPAPTKMAAPKRAAVKGPGKAVRGAKKAAVNVVTQPAAEGPAE